MSDVFNRQVTFGGSYLAEEANMTFSEGIPGTLVQNIQIAYQQEISKMYELGNGKKTYFVAGRTSGNMTFGRIIGPAPISEAFYEKFGDICNAATNTLSIKANSTFCGTNGNSTNYIAVDCSGCSITNIGVAMGADNMVINEQVGMVFVQMDISTG